MPYSGMLLSSRSSTILRGALLCASRKRSTSSVSTCAWSQSIFLSFSLCRFGVCSTRLSVLLPAKASQSERSTGASFPASVLNLFRDIFPAARCVLLICFLSTTNTPQLAAGIFYYWILAQLIVVVKVLITQHQTEDPLPNYRLDLMLDIAGIAPVAEAGGKPTHQPEAAIHQAQQQPTRVRSDVATVETGHHRAPIHWFKFEQLRRTVCLHRGSPLDLARPS